MTRKIFDSVDGFTVDTYATTFSGNVETEMTDARHMAYDDELLVVARVRVKMPRLKEAKNGDITRVNVLGLHELALVRSDSLKKHLIETLGLQDMAEQLQLPVVPESVTSEPETEVSTNGASSGATVSETESESWTREVPVSESGPKVVPFSLDSPGSEVHEVEVLGQVKAKEDEFLSAFMAESYK